MSDKKKLAIAVKALREINRIQPRDFDFTTVKDISAKAFVEMGRVKLEQESGKLHADKSEADKKRDLEIEKEAKHIYNGWKDQRGWIPWVEPGNSHMQERARDLARISVSASHLANKST